MCKNKDQLLPGHGACAGCGEVLTIRYVLQVLGKNTAVVVPASCMSQTMHSPFPHRAFDLSDLEVAFAAGAPIASGVKIGLDVKGRGDTTVAVLAGDGATADIGLAGLSGAVDRGHDLVYVCSDNQAYMNTGIQRSGTTPYGAWTKTTPVAEKSMYKREESKNIPIMLAAQGAPFVATVTPAYPKDLREKVKKAREVDGVGYIHSLSPCPPGWGFPPEKTIQLSKEAIETGAWVLFEIENGEKVTLNKKPKDRKPIKEYLTLQNRFKHLTKEEIDRIQEKVDKNWEHIEKGELFCLKTLP